MKMGQLSLRLSRAAWWQVGRLGKEPGGLTCGSFDLCTDHVAWRGALGHRFCVWYVFHRRDRPGDLNRRRVTWVPSRAARGGVGRLGFGSVCPKFLCAARSNPVHRISLFFSTGLVTRDGGG